MTGTERLAQATGVRLGGQRLELIYNTETAARATGAMNSNGDEAALSGQLGKLWWSSWHRRLAVSSLGPSIQALRGSSPVTSFVRDGTNRLVARGSTDSLEVTSGAYSYFYRDQSALLLEAYDSGGSIKKSTRASGESITATYSDANTPSATAPAPGYLLNLQDAFGRAVTFTYATLSNGVVVLRTATEPGGSVTTFEYDGTSGNLLRIVWPDTTKKTFGYGPAGTALSWALTSVTDENSQLHASISYSPEGWVQSSQLAGGVDQYVVNYTTPPRPVTREVLDTVNHILWRYHEWVAPVNPSITMPNGSVASLNSVSLFGSVAGQGATYLSGKGQPAGSGCAASASSQPYDANGNVASKDDFNGSRSCYAYDAERNLETIRVEGLANTATCSNYIGAGATLPPGSRKVSTVWHPNWRLPSRVVEAGRLTTNVYHGQPDPFSGGALASCAPGTALLPDGKPIAVLCKQVEQATTDTDGGHSTLPPSDASFTSGVTLLVRADGANGSMAFADSSSLLNAVIPQGGAGGPQISTAQSKFGGSSAKFVAASAQALRVPVTTPAAELPGDFTVEAWAYWNSDPAAKTTIFANQLAGGVNLSLYRHPVQNHALVWYDGQGQVNRIIGTTRITNGVWHHVALVRTGSTITIFLDGVSQGSYTGFTGKVSPVGTSQYIGAFNGNGDLMEGYIDEVRVTKGQALYGATFTPPTTAPATPTQPNVPLDATVATRVRSWTYDQNGQVLTAKGPRTDVNDTTTYEYYSDTVFTGTDPNAVGHTTGDLKKTTNALAQSINYMKYDKHSQVLESTDLNGVVTANTYDARQRLLTTSVGGLTTSYAYDFAGQLLKVTQPDTSWVGYEYDAAHRMNAVKDNLGNRIEYTLDNAGNKTAEKVKDPAGLLKRQLTRSFDALGRVQQTTGRQ